MQSGYEYQAVLVRTKVTHTYWEQAWDLIHAIVVARFPYIAAAFLTGFVWGLVFA